MHPKVRALLVAVVVLILASVAGSLNGTVAWHTTLVSDATAVLALVVTYLKGSTGA